MTCTGKYNCTACQVGYTGANCLSCATNFTTTATEGKQCKKKTAVCTRGDTIDLSLLPMFRDWGIQPLPGYDYQAGCPWDAWFFSQANARWYKFSPAGDAVYRFQVSGTSVTPWMLLRECIANNTNLGCNWGALSYSPSDVIMDFQLLQERTYYLIVGEFFTNNSMQIDFTKRSFSFLTRFFFTPPRFDSIL